MSGPPTEGARTAHDDAAGHGRAGRHAVRWPRSLRWRLTLTYAGLALLTAVVLGAILIAVLSGYYSRAETEYVESVADRAVRDVRGDPDVDRPLEQTVRLIAFGTKTRIQLLDASGDVVADSGSPLEVDESSLLLPPAGHDQAPGPGQSGEGQGQQSAQEQGQGQQPIRIDTLGSLGDEAGRSDKVAERAALAGSGSDVATIRVSEAPAAGSRAMRSVIIAWSLAAGGAVLCAAGAGYLLSSRITRPVVALAEASDRMAEGDLATRAEVGGDDEIGRLARSFNQMATRVEATVASLQRFVSDAAHQLGTPLTALRADLELAEDAAVDDDARRLLACALEQEQRLEDLGSGLLQLSRLQTPETAMRTQLVELPALLRECIDAYASRAEQADLELRPALDDAGPPLRVDTDPVLLRTALENLLDNAVKFTPPGGSVELGARVGGRPPEGTRASQGDAARPQCALLWVADTGPGIPADERRRVFERFYRTADASDRPGSGLGLSIVRAAVEASGGTVRLAESERGARFEVRLPLHTG